MNVELDLHIKKLDSAISLLRDFASHLSTHQESDFGDGIKMALRIIERKTKETLTVSCNNGEWISTSIRFPKPGQNVMAHGSGSFWVSEYRIEYQDMPGLFICSDKKIRFVPEITHWMPMPNVPNR